MITKLFIFLLVHMFLATQVDAQSFPFQQLENIKWGMSLDDLKKTMPVGEVKIEKGKPLYMVKDFIYGHPAGLGFGLSKNEAHLIHLSIIFIRNTKRPEAELGQLLNQLITLLTTYHGNPVADKKIMGQRAMKWNTKGSSLLFIGSNDVIAIAYSEPKK